MEPEIGVMQSQAKDGLEPSEVGRSKDWILPKACRTCRHLILVSGF